MRRWRNCLVLSLVVLFLILGAVASGGLFKRPPIVTHCQGVHLMFVDIPPKLEPGQMVGFEVVSDGPEGIEGENEQRIQGKQVRLVKLRMVVLDILPEEGEE